MTDADLRQHLSADVDLLGDVLQRDPGAAVEHCPGWSVADLARHHGSVLRWAAEVVRTGSVAAERDDGPHDHAELVTWYAQSATELLGALATIDPERPCWTFDGPPGQTWFWTRRQALEAAIHRWDAQHAVGAAGGFPPEVARAGLTEVAEVMYPRQVRLERTPALTAPLRLRATDLDETWELAGAPDGPAAPAAEVAGPAGTLLLLLWRRTDLGHPDLAVDASPARRGELETTLFAP